MLLHPPVWADCVSQKLWVYVWGSSQLWPAKSPPVRCSQLWGNPCWKVGMRCTENPSWGADLYLVLSSFARWARCCHLCSSQTVPSVQGNRVSITGYIKSPPQKSKSLGNSVSQAASSPASLALTAPRKGSCKAMVASCIASQCPWSPGSWGDFAWLSFTQGCWRAPAGEATWPQAVSGGGGGQGEWEGLSLMWWALGPAPSWRRGRNWTVGRVGEGLFTLPRDGGRWSDRYNVEA